MKKKEPTLEKIRIKIGTKIRMRRKQLDMDPKVFGKKIKVSRGTVSNIENAKQSVSSERLWQIAVALGCTPNDLMPPVPEEYKDFEKNLKKIEDDEAKKWAQNVIISSPPLE